MYGFSSRTIERPVDYDVLGAGSSHSDVQEHLTCRRGARRGFHPNTGACHEREVQGDSKQKAASTQGRPHNLSTSALT
ncbi:hypothetical protein EYF80_047539 [Liparis tanakae]|uniref:Uncharacterized protein n=1 Tax=Liparis tanakae TaxID=230148 RepID=A0A4Z2FMQ4_9TELE|nr:hypothetical protein EYF80_047539 [Liparis tanakae]